MSSVKCPSCGAANAEGAQWCGQCLMRFAPMPSDPGSHTSPPGHAGAAAPPAENAPPSEMVPSAESAPSAGESPAAGIAASLDDALAGPAPRAASPAARPALRSVPQAGVHRAGEGLVWKCPACENENPIEAPLCSVCATPMSALFKEPKPAVKRTGGAVVALSAVLPGAGHAWAGRGVEAAGRIVLFIWTVGIGVLLITRSGSRAAGVFRGVGFVFVISAIAVWLISLIESQRLAKGEAFTLVPGRALMWATVALTLVLFVGLAAGAQAR